MAVLSEYDTDMYSLYIKKSTAINRRKKIYKISLNGIFE